MNDDKSMKQLLALMCVVDWLANDMHYKVRGPNFYELHLLADRVREVGNDDEIKEAYWLGFRNTPPPADTEIARLAISAYEKISVNGVNYLQALKTAFEVTLEVVEVCKREAGLPAGIHAILDSISQKALTYKFLVSAATL